MNEGTLLKAIEQKRNQLIKIGLTNGLNCSTVLELSQELDRLLNQYERNNEELN